MPREKYNGYEDYLKKRANGLPEKKDYLEHCQDYSTSLPPDKDSIEKEEPIYPGASLPPDELQPIAPFNLSNKTEGSPKQEEQISWFRRLIKGLATKRQD